MEHPNQVNVLGIKQLVGQYATRFLMMGGPASCMLALNILGLNQVSERNKTPQP